MSLANPYWIIWWLTIGLGLLLSAQKAGYIGIVAFFMGHILADFIWYSAASYTITKGKKFISQKVYKNIILVCAVTLIGFGIFFCNTFFYGIFIAIASMASYDIMTVKECAKPTKQRHILKKGHWVC